MAKIFTFLFATALLFALAQARPAAESSSEITLEEVKNGLTELVLGLDWLQYTIKEIGDVSLHMLLTVEPIIQDVVKDLATYEPKNAAFKHKIAKLAEFSKKVEELSELEAVLKSDDIWMELEEFLEKYHALDESNPDDAHLKKTLIKHGIKKAIEEFYHRKIVFALNLRTKIYVQLRDAEDNKDNKALQSFSADLKSTYKELVEADADQLAHLAYKTIKAVVAANKELEAKMKE